ncbi:MAG: DUF397 domain-containing protein [Actinomadura sp.]
MISFDLSHATWRKATASTGSNGACVDLATNLPPALAAMRDSTRPEAGAHVTSRAALRALVADAKAGRYDL